jgi:hypothetical protein
MISIFQFHSVYKKLDAKCLKLTATLKFFENAETEPPSTAMGENLAATLKQIVGVQRRGINPQKQQRPPPLNVRILVLLYKGGPIQAEDG